MDDLFPDKNLERVIRQAVGKPEGTLSIEDLAGLSQLNAVRKGIADLEGLQHCRSLQNLFLDHNGISDITALAGLSDLNVLHLDGNGITDIGPVAGLVNLVILGLDSNPIQDLAPIVGLRNIARLGLSTDGLRDISALVDCEGLGPGDWIYFTGTPAGSNPFDEQIAVLRKRGVIVYGVP
jgi:internalin A